MKKLLVLLLMLLPSLGYSHSKVSGTVPENGAILATAPKEIVFNFDKGIRLVSVQVDDQPLPLPSFDGFAKTMTVDVPELLQGLHHVEWSGLSNDGHPVSGSFSFAVQ